MTVQMMIGLYDLNHAPKMMKTAVSEVLIESIGPISISPPIKFNQLIEKNLPESITDGSKSTKIALGTWRPDPVDEKKVEKESSEADTESALSIFSKYCFIFNLIRGMKLIFNDLKCLKNIP